MADIDPLRLDKTRFRSHPDLDVLTHGLTLWDLDREFKVDGFAGKQYKKLRDVLSVLRDAYCRHIGVEYTHILEPEQQTLAAGARRDQARQADRRRAEVHPVASSTRPRRSKRSCRPNTLGRSGSRSRAPRP